MMKDINVYKFEGIDYVIVDQVDDPEDFIKWLDGQTVPEIPDVSAAYFWDYKRYIERKKLKNKS